MNRQIISILACVALSLCVAHPAQAGLINGSFEEPYINVLLQSNYIDYQPGVGILPGWTVEAGSVDVVSGGGIQAAVGSQYLDLNGFSPGTISQTMSATAGQTYQLSFDYSGYYDPGYGSSAGNSVFYQLFDGSTQAVLAQGSILIQSSNLLNWSLGDLQATATSDSLGIRFWSDGKGADNFLGPVIDDVIMSPITPTGIPVPEPSSVCLSAIAGIMALGFRLRNR